MLPIKLERAIFIIVFAICFIVCICFTSQIKANDLPINAGMTTEQVIEAEYKDKSGKLDYKYTIDDNIMFVCVETKSGYCELNYAFRNGNSGFMFKVPGMFSWSLRNEKSYYLNVPESDQLYITIGKVHSRYYVSIHDIYQKRNIDFYKDGQKLEVLTLENTENQYWIGVIDNISEFKEIKGTYNGKTINIVNAEEIKELFGEEGD